MTGNTLRTNAFTVTTTIYRDW